MRFRVTFASLNCSHFSQLGKIFILIKESCRLTFNRGKAFNSKQGSLELTPLVLLVQMRRRSNGLLDHFKTLKAESLCFYKVNLLRRLISTAFPSIAVS